MDTAPHSPPLYDTLIIGGGPGGLTAALYLRRFRRNIMLVDKGHSRLAWIPVSHNYPGFPDGIHGKQLLANLRAQLTRYGGAVTEGEVAELSRDEEHFIATVDDGTQQRTVHARTVLLATGIADAGMPVERFFDAVACGSVRLCPVCDGYDVLDQKVAVVTSATNPVGHAMFMRTFTADVTVFERQGSAALGRQEQRALDAAQIRYVTSPLKGVTLDDEMQPILHTEDGASHHFDVLYPMLGATARSELALALGAAASDCQTLTVDEHQATTVPGLYAVGDVTRGLNQISVAAGQAAIAATHIHNSLPHHLRERRS